MEKKAFLQICLKQLYHLTCPSSGTLTLVLVEGQKCADATVGTGVVGITRGVQGNLAMLAGVAKRAGAGGTARYRPAC